MSCLLCPTFRYTFNQKCRCYIEFNTFLYCRICFAVAEILLLTRLSVESGHFKNWSKPAKNKLLHYRRRFILSCRGVCFNSTSWCKRSLQLLDEKFFKLLPFMLLHQDHLKVKDILQLLQERTLQQLRVKMIIYYYLCFQLLLIKVIPLIV